MTNAERLKILHKKGKNSTDVYVAESRTKELLSDMPLAINVLKDKSNTAKNLKNSTDVLNAVNRTNELFQDYAFVTSAPKKQNCCTEKNAKNFTKRRKLSLNVCVKIMRTLKNEKTRQIYNR